MLLLRRRARVQSIGQVIAGPSKDSNEAASLALVTKRANSLDPNPRLNLDGCCLMEERPLDTTTSLDILDLS